MNKPIYRFLSGKSGAGAEIRILMRQSARAFGAEAPKTTGLSAAELRKAYARFTADEAMRALAGGQDLKALRKDLFRMACRLGSGVRRWLRPRSERECYAILVMLYRNIGITIREARPGIFCVSECYFSSFYTPEVCSVIAAIDQGIFAGVCGGGRLVFRKRITEGCDECTADFKKKSRGQK